MRRRWWFGLGAGSVLAVLLLIGPDGWVQAGIRGTAIREGVRQAMLSYDFVATPHAEAMPVPVPVSAPVFVPRPTARRGGRR